MKTRTLLSLISVLAVQLLPCAAQPPKPKPNAAQASDKVWVIVNPVKVDKQVQFERFINNIFWVRRGQAGPG